MKESKLGEEIKKLNEQLGEIKNKSRLMIYSANPVKFALFNFLAGIFHTLGALFGYIVIFGAVAWFLSRINLGSLLNRFMENTFSQIKWEKIMPMPQIPEESRTKSDEL